MKLIFSFLFLLSFFVVNAQDIIYTSGKTKMECKVLEVGASEIKYKLASNQDGPVYVIAKSDVVLITYKNGTFENFASGHSSSGKNDSLSLDFCRNSIGIDAAQFATTSLGVVYERIFGKRGYWGIRIPFTVGMENSSYNTNYSNGKLFATGLDLEYFPTGQGKFKYFFSPYFEYGLYKYTYYQYQYYYSGSEYTDGRHIAGGIKNGVQYNPTRHFCFSADFGFGIQNNDTPYYAATISEHFQGNVIIGFRF